MSDAEARMEAHRMKMAAGMQRVARITASLARTAARRGQDTKAAAWQVSSAKEYALSRYARDGVDS